MIKSHIFNFNKHSILILILFLFSHSQAQDKKDLGFRSPLDIPLYLAGNFGELRSNHFHTGIDIKTQGVEGKAVYSIEDGYISRIKISTEGYGKAIYITHPNGYTSVYGHLLKGSERVENFIQLRQYEKESFTIEIFPQKNELRVEKGEMIAFSGNTGSSGGPHLHFEIRETATEEAVNPLLFGFAIQDNIQPIIKGIRIYAMDDESFVSSYPANSLAFPVSGNYGNYHLNDDPQIKVYGRIALAVHTYDLLNGYPNKCGIYKIELRVDSQLVFETEFEKLNFSHLRYINTYTDYPLFKESRKYYHKQFIGENNQLKIYAVKDNKGILEFTDNRTHQIDYTIRDSYGNTSGLSFELKALDQIPMPLSRETNKDALKLFTVKGANYYSDEDITIDVPMMALYEDMEFTYSKKPAPKNCYGPMYVIGNIDVPLQKNFTLHVNENPVPERYQDKALFVSIDSKGGMTSAGGGIKDGKMTLTSRSFGTYSIAVDTIAPIIKPINISPNKDLSTYNTFSVKISDNLSGIKEYRGEIDGRWILMEYETKKESLTYRFDNDKVAKGKHVFSLRVSDNEGNEKRYEASFIR